MSLNIEKILAERLGIRENQAKEAMALLDEGCTVPFIARYRKEKTGGLSDETLRRLEEERGKLNALEDRRETVLRQIEAQEKLSPELEKEIMAADSMTLLEDLYRPYKKKRRTRGEKAREAGYGDAGDALFAGESSEELLKAFPDREEALAGIRDVAAEKISDDPGIRDIVRKEMLGNGLVMSETKNDDGRFSMYENFEEKVKTIPGHRILALNRGEKEEALRVSVSVSDAQLLEKILRYLKASDPVLKEAAEDAYGRLIYPSAEREIRNLLTEKAEEGALRVFEKNLRPLLMMPPVRDKRVLALDPGFRNGCKTAVIGEKGELIDYVVLQAAISGVAREKGKEKFKKLIRRYHPDLIALGNGTASRETELFVSEVLSEMGESLPLAVVDESGASIYSASPLAGEELPDADVGARSAASLGRRLQDPLSELVKMDPKTLGVGQYQHDVNQKRLGEVLSGVVEACVNEVGVDLNTASVPLLSFVAGLSKKNATAIVHYRQENGPFKTRTEVKKVPGIGPKTFEQAAGFLRIPGGACALDNTAVHPESYGAARDILKGLGVSEESLATGKGVNVKDGPQDTATIRDIKEELRKPGRDIRNGMPGPVFKKDVMTIEDLKAGEVLTGTVRNVTDFGAFVDIGVHCDGLVHISQLSGKKFVKHPLDEVSVGDVIKVKVLDVDVKRERIQLSRKGLEN